MDILIYFMANLYRVYNCIKKYKVVWYGGLLSLTRKINVAIIIRVFTIAPLLEGEEFDLPFSYNLQVCWPPPSEKGLSVEGTQMGGFSHKSRLIIAHFGGDLGGGFKTNKEEERRKRRRKTSGEWSWLGSLGALVMAAGTKADHLVGFYASRLFGRMAAYGGQMM